MPFPEQQATLVVVQGRVVEAQDGDGEAGLDDAPRGGVVDERPKPADHVAEVETPVIEAHDRAHRVAARFEHVDVTAAHVEERDQALDDRLDHLVRLEARGKVEARFDDQRQVALAGVELGHQAGVLDGDRHVPAHLTGEAHLFGGERGGARRPAEDHGPDAEREDPQRYDEHALQFELVQVRRWLAVALGEPGMHVGDGEHFVVLECVAQHDERLVRIAQGARVGARTEGRFAAPLVVAHDEGDTDGRLELDADAPHGAVDQVVRLAPPTRLSDDVGLGPGETRARERRLETSSS